MKKTKSKKTFQAFRDAKTKARRSAATAERAKKNLLLQLERIAREAITKLNNDSGVAYRFDGFTWVEFHPDQPHSTLEITTLTRKSDGVIVDDWGLEARSPEVVASLARLKTFIDHRLGLREYKIHVRLQELVVEVDPPGYY